VYPAGGVLTLRMLVAAGTTITNFIVSIFTEPQPLSATYPSSTFPSANVPVPGTDF
jgi:hypothetical protein